MRIYDPDNDQTMKEVEVYLTESEAAQLLADLLGLVNDVRVKKASVADAGFAHRLSIFKYSKHEQSGFDPRRKEILVRDA
ncbi:MAG TPA: hypothetical protein PLF13_03780 [candidate division Zixibacteria bacterium]|nr:hypothetical protein [candidate division Zixibacteria bacterium]